MKIGYGVMAIFALSKLGCAEGERPLVLGKGKERFVVGDVLQKDDFENLERWVVQVEEKAGFPEAKVAAKDGVLDCLVPGRGCTIWFREKLKTRLTITYDVVCPEAKEGMKGVMVKDVNNFWLASDSENEDEGLFDSERYTGNFTSYNKMNGYYASSGGARNTTVRMRRYPREKNSQGTKHIALQDRDRQKDFLLTPGKRMKVQLVAFDDLVQYIVDGVLVYEMSFGEEVTVEGARGEGRQLSIEQYGAQDYPFYQEGFFGFRMVGTHHRYSNFRVHELNALGG